MLASLIVMTVCCFKCALGRVCVVLYFDLCGKGIRKQLRMTENASITRLKL